MLTYDYSNFGIKNAYSVILLFYISFIYPIIAILNYDVKTNKTIFVKTEGDKEQYLTNIAWSPDEKHIYIAVLSRTQNDMKLNEYDAAT